MQIEITKDDFYDLNFNPFKQKYLFNKRFNELRRYKVVGFHINSGTSTPSFTARYLINLYQVDVKFLDQVLYYISYPLHRYISIAKSGIIKLW